MSETRWKCRRCKMTFREFNGKLGNAGKCQERGCEVVHGSGEQRGSNRPKPWVRPGQTADLRRMEQ